MKSRIMLLGAMVSASHPSRGAWIEIRLGSGEAATITVAPLTGCVD